MQGLLFGPTTTCRWVRSWCSRAKTAKGYLCFLFLVCVLCSVCVSCACVCVLCLSLVSPLRRLLHWFARSLRCRRRSAISLPIIWFGVGFGMSKTAGLDAASFCVDSLHFAHSFVNSQHYARFAFCRVRV